jgi:hypothetical protein
VDRAVVTAEEGMAAVATASAVTRATVDLRGALRDILQVVD